MKAEWIVIAAAAAIAAIAVWAARPACAQGGCLPTFCGTSSECPPGCFCAIPLGSATGTCSGTR